MQPDRETERDNTKVFRQKIHLSFFKILNIINFLSTTMSKTLISLCTYIQ